MSLFVAASAIHHIAIIIFSVSSFFFLALGSFWYKNINFLRNELTDGLTYMTYSLMAVGVLMLILSVLGCCGFYSKSSRLLFVYLAMLAVLFVAFIVQEFVICEYFYDLTDALKKGLRKEMEYCKPDSFEYILFQKLQDKFSCCGVDSIEDWKLTSCAEIANQCKPDTRNIGCAKAITDDNFYYLLGVGLVSLAIMAVKIVAYVAACIIGSKFRKTTIPNPS